MDKIKIKCSLGLKLDMSKDDSARLVEIYSDSKKTAIIRYLVVLVSTNKAITILDKVHGGIIDNIKEYKEQVKSIANTILFEFNEMLSLDMTAAHLEMDNLLVRYFPIYDFNKYQFSSYEDIFGLENTESDTIIKSLIDNHKYDFIVASKVIAKILSDVESMIDVSKQNSTDED